MCSRCCPHRSRRCSSNRRRHRHWNPKQRHHSRSPYLPCRRQSLRIHPPQFLRCPQKTGYFAGAAPGQIPTDHPHRRCTRLASPRLPSASSCVVWCRVEGGAALRVRACGVHDQQQSALVRRRSLNRFQFIGAMNKRRSNGVNTYVYTLVHAKLRIDRGSDVQIDQPPIEGLAFLDELLLLQQLFEGEVRLVQYELTMMKQNVFRRRWH